MKNTITILVVDDEVMMRNLLKKILCKDGFNVVLAENGQEALKLLENNSVDLLICDMVMPQMSGLDLLSIIKRRFPHVCVVMMTTYGDAHIVKDALLLGADEYITKPFKSHEVSLVVERAYWRICSSISRTADKTN